jgi:hypothetical protein
MVHPEPVMPILIDDKIGFLLNTHASDLSDKFLKTSDACNTFFNQFIRLWENAKSWPVAKWEDGTYHEPLV